MCLVLPIQAVSPGELWASTVGTGFGVTPLWFTEVSLGVCHQEGNTLEKKNFRICT